MGNNPQRTNDTVVRAELAAIIGLLSFSIFQEYLGENLGEYLKNFLKERSKNNGKNGEKNNKNSGNSIW